MGHDRNCFDLVRQPEFVSFRENVDTGGPLGRAMIVIIGAIAELERNLIVERVRAGMRRARLEGRQIGRAPLEVNRPALLLDRQRGMTLKQLAKAYGISKASVCRVIKDAQQAVSKGCVPAACVGAESKELRPPIPAA